MKIGRVTVTGYNDLQVLIENSLRDDKSVAEGAACFVDAGSLMHMAYIKCNGKSDYLLKQTQKGKHDSQEVAVMNLAREISIPLLLIGEGKATEFNQDRRKLPALPDYASFDTGHIHGGMKSTLEENLGQVYVRYANYIDNTLDGNAQVAALNMLAASNSFVTGLITWMQTQFISLTNPDEKPRE